MSRYLVDQLAARANIRVLYRTEVVAAHGDTSLEAIDVRTRDHRPRHFHLRRRPIQPREARRGGGR
jgi:thioredoxin reductase